MSLGWVIVIVGFVVLLAWIPLRQRLGIGTIVNTVLVGTLVKVFLPHIGAPDPIDRAHRDAASDRLPRSALGGGLYIGAALGPGPRDGLMTAITARGHRLWVVRTVLELSVFAVGWMLGGNVGVGTALIAFSLGPVVHFAVRRFHLPVPVRLRRGARRVTRRGVVGVAVIGTGFGARVVAPAFAATEGVEVVAVVSARDEDAVAAAAADARVDLVSVHSPPFLHERHVGMALDSGRSVLCDKPFTASAESSRRLVDAARDAPGVHLLNFEFRFDPLRRRTRELVRRGRARRRRTRDLDPSQRGIAPSAAAVRLAVRPRAWRRLDRRVGIARGRRAPLLALVRSRRS